MDVELAGGCDTLVPTVFTRSKQYILRDCGARDLSASQVLARDPSSSLSREHLLMQMAAIQERLGEMPTGATALGADDDDDRGAGNVLTLGGGASDPVVAFVTELIRAQVRVVCMRDVKEIPTIV